MENKIQKSILISFFLLLSGCGSNFVQLQPLKLPDIKYKQSKIDKTISFAIARPRLIVKTKISPSLERGIARRLQYDINTIYCHLASEMEKILTSKGIAVNDVFESRENMTFTQKKETTALLYPIITIDLYQLSNSIADESSGMIFSTYGNMVVKTNIDLVMVEPLSGEKVWIKHIKTLKKTLPLKYSNNIYANNNPFQIQKELKNVMDQIDELLVTIDKQILQSVDKYITKEEFLYLNNDIKKLKNIKRY